MPLIFLGKAPILQLSKSPDMAPSVETITSGTGKGATSAIKIPAAQVPTEVVINRSFQDSLDEHALLAAFLAAPQSPQVSSKVLVEEAFALEKKHRSSDMMRIWSELFFAFPREEMPLRLLMRWYRRTRQVDEGLKFLRQHLEKPEDDPERGLASARGLAELQAYLELDELMTVLLARYPDAQKLRLQYIKALGNQQRYQEAVQLIDGIANRGQLGPGARQLVEGIIELAVRANGPYIGKPTALMAQLVYRFRNRIVQPLNCSAIGKVVFYTGQLGAGGAERQFTRISSALAGTFDHQRGAEGLCLGVLPEVCVKHADPGTGSDFFLPVLIKSGVETSVLTKMRVPAPQDLVGIDPELVALFELLPPDISTLTMQLIPYFQSRRVSVAYLWQDGGVLSGALAALCAGVPRIIASFRGMPPSVRPEMFRSPMPSFYKALFAIPGVTFSANSISTAKAYERWLDLPVGSIAVVYNAVPPISSAGTPGDEDRWAAIKAASPGRDKTVLGIFRFDPNKRPELWIEMALDYCKRHQDTRFVIVGAGHDFSRCRALIDQAGATGQVFLAGMTSHVGYWLSCANVLMHLARLEGLPNVLIEAQLAGVPVLCTPAGGSAEIVKNRRTGIVLSGGDVPDKAEIQSALERLLNEPVLHDRMSRTAAQYSAGRFDMDQAVERTLLLFVGATLPPPPS